MGAVWAGETEASPPEPLDFIIDTTPAWKPVVEEFSPEEVNSALLELKTGKIRGAKVLIIKR